MLTVRTGSAPGGRPASTTLGLLGTRSMLRPLRLIGTGISEGSLELSVKGGEPPEIVSVFTTPAYHVAVAGLTASGPRSLMTAVAPPPPQLPSRNAPTNART